MVQRISQGLRTLETLEIQEYGSPTCASFPTFRFDRPALEHDKNSLLEIMGLLKFMPFLLNIDHTPMECMLLVCAIHLDLCSSTSLLQIRIRLFQHPGAKDRLMELARFFPVRGRRGPPGCLECHLNKTCCERMLRALSGRALSRTRGI